MSRIGKQPIIIPENVTVTLNEGTVNIKGPKGELSRFFKDDIEITISDGEIILKPRKDTISSKALWGTYASHIKNMVYGVTEGFEKKLIIEGVGYRVALSGDELTLNLGFSHPINVSVPDGIEVIAEKNNISVKGIDKELVGKFTAYIRSLRKPEPYKGKGIRYSDEIIRRKQGKKSV